MGPTQISTHLLVGIALLAHNARATPGNFVTTVPHSGRFGDQLILYARARLVASVHGLPLLHRPFAYSDQLRLYTAERRYTDGLVKKLHPVGIDSIELLPRQPSSTMPQLYVVNFFTKIEGVTAEQYTDIYTHLQRAIRPRDKLRLVNPPHDEITVAMHVRRGGGYLYDHLAKYIFKTKFLAIDYYITALQQLIKMYPRKKIYAYIFTDDPNPPGIERELAAALNNPYITFDCRHGINKHDKNVLEDFFSMTRFDCLIRPSSSFSRMAELLGNHTIVISPSGTRIKQPPAAKLQRILSINPMLYKISAIPNFFCQTWR